ncbi:MAG TPA: hypothetical protein VKM72_03290 [Thermoanaerobaculia bacterium]|nr:hypothetical protein [Thermoanaerobaculia bacterium]
MKKRTPKKKLSLNKETLLNLKSVAGGIAQFQGVDSEGPDICYFSDCNPCETTIYADRDL